MSDALTDAKIVEELETARLARLSKGWGKYQPKQPIASDLSDCDRYQIMRIIAWEVREPPDAEGKAMIEQGQAMEPVVLRQLEEEGWTVVEQQSPIEIRQPLEDGGPRRTILTGRMDAKIRFGKRLLPMDVKDTSEWTLDAIDTDADLRTQSQWTRKWWRQMQVYMLGANIDTSILYLAFRGKRKPVVVHLDYEEGERILKLCTWTVKLCTELLEQGVDQNTVNDRLAALDIQYHHDFSVCRICPFRDRACYPPVPAPGKMVLRKDLESIVARYVELKPLSSEYERLKKTLKGATEGNATTVAGQYVIDGEVKTRRMKAKPAIGEHVQEFWQFEVRK